MLKKAMLFSVMMISSVHCHTLMTGGYGTYPLADTVSGRQVFDANRFTPKEFINFHHGLPSEERKGFFVDKLGDKQLLAIRKELLTRVQNAPRFDMTDFRRDTIKQHVIMLLKLDEAEISSGQENTRMIMGGIGTYPLGKNSEGRTIFRPENFTNEEFAHFIPTVKDRNLTQSLKIRRQKAMEAK